MTPDQWKKEFDGRLTTVYLFVGEEDFLVQWGIKQLQGNVFSGQENVHMDVVDLREQAIDRLMEHCQTLSLFGGFGGGGKRLILARNIDALKEKDWAPLLSYLENPASDTCLLLTAKKLDQRKKPFKSIQKAGKVFPCKALSWKEVDTWIRHFAQDEGKKISYECIGYLKEVIGTSLYELSNAIVKTSIYGDEKAEIELADVEAVVARTNLQSIFNFLDALGSRRLAVAIKLLQDLRQAHEPEVRVVYMITRHFRILTQLKGGLKQRLSSQVLAKQLHLPPWSIRRYMDQACLHSEKKLFQIYDRLFHLDLALKSSRTPRWNLLEQAVMQICKST